MSQSKYNYANEDEESSYESDDGSIYKPAIVNKYKFIQYNINKPISNRSIQINPRENYFEYFFDNYLRELQYGVIQYSDLTSDVTELAESIKSSGVSALYNYRNTITLIMIKNGHLRKGYYGLGTYAQARLYINEKTGNTKVVLDPIRDRCNYKESRKKARFFKTAYSDNNPPQKLAADSEMQGASKLRREAYMQIHEDSRGESTKQFSSAVECPKNSNIFYEEVLDKNTYRMVVPNIPGIFYGDLKITERESQMKCFLATVVAIKNLHKNLIFLDLSPHNISYLAPDEAHNNIGISFLIDGGFSSLPGESLDPENFMCANEEIIATKIQKQYYIAPECWYTNQASAADPSMDIYSMGKILANVFNPMSEDLCGLIASCTNINPNKRPSLASIESILVTLLMRSEQNKNVASYTF